MKLLEVAARVAFGNQSPAYEFRKNYLIAALSQRTDGAIVISPNIICHTPVPGAHAEARVLRKSDANCTIYVARTTRDNKWAMSKPCPNCQKLIRSRRVKKVYFTIGEGEYGIWNVSKDEWITVKRHYENGN